MIDPLMRYGAKLPNILKWPQCYYFERYDAAAYLMEKGMTATVKSWQNVTLLHDMAQKGFIDKATLLIKYGAAITAVDDVYQSTPLGLAARWGHSAMVEYLLSQGAELNKAGACWATPLAWARAKRHQQVE